MERPTPEQTRDARSRVLYWLHPSRIHLLGEQCEPAIRVLLAATEPPTDKELASALLIAGGNEPNPSSVAYATSILTNERPIAAGYVRDVVRHFLGAPEPK
jgi:hypothetical protein